MKKKIFALFSIMTVVLAMVVPSYAADFDSEVWNGTPILDGQLDDNYKKSFSFSLTFEANAGWAYGTGESDGDAALTTYFLHDDQFLYIFHECTDSNITSPADEAVYTDQLLHQCLIDQVEISFGDGDHKILATGDGKMVQVVGQAGAVPIEMIALDKIDIINDDGIAAGVQPSAKGYLDPKYGDMSNLAPMQVAYAQTDKGYNWEIAMPIHDDFIANSVKAWIQISDVDTEKGYDDGLFLSPSDVIMLKLSDKDAGDTPIPAEVVDTPNNEATAPATMDPVTMAVAAIVTAGAAVFVTRKNKR